MLNDFKDFSDKIKIKGRNQKLALDLVEEAWEMDQDELRRRLRENGLDQPAAYKVVESLINKDALTLDNGMVSVADNVEW